MRRRVGLIALATFAVAATPWNMAAAASKSKAGADAPRVRAAIEEFRSRMSLRRMGAREVARSSAAQLVPSTSVHDPVGDAASAHGDITGAGFAQNSHQLSFAMKVVSPTDPARDTHWRNGHALAAWLVDTNNDGAPEYVVGLLPDRNGQLLALMVSLASFVSLSSLQICVGSASYIARSGYEATFAKNCLRPGLWFRFRAAMLYGSSPDDLSPPIDIAPDRGWSPPQITTQVAGQSGYWTLDVDGHVNAFGGADEFSGAVSGAAALAPRKDGTGYWIAGRAGDVHAYGSARYFGGSPPLFPGEYVSSISATATGHGYWLFSNTGRVFAYGDARWYGDMSGTHLNGSIVATTPTPSGHGYYMVGSDGGIFTFGDAHFHGSTGALRLNAPIVGMATTANGHGYWLVARDGGVFAFGAPFRGSMGAVRLNQPVVAIAHYGDGYLMTGADGGIFDFSDRPFHGSLANQLRFAPVVGLAAFVT